MVSTFRHPHLFCGVHSIGLREMKWLSLAQAIILHVRDKMQNGFDVDVETPTQT
jgi:hypothetical protein